MKLSASSRLRSLLALAVLCCIGCGGSVSGPTPSSSVAAAPPDGSVISKQYAFALYPVEGATLFDDTSVKGIHAQGSAGMQMGDKWAGVVIVERLPNTTLDAFAQLLKRSWGDEGNKLESESRLTFAGQDAIRIERTSRSAEHAIRIFNTFFVRGGFGYQVVAWQYVGVRGEPEAFFQAFHLVDGEIGAAEQAVAGDRFGPTFGIVDNVFMGLLSGVKVRPQGGWAFVSESERLHINGDAELLMHHRETGAYVMIVPDDIPQKSQNAYRVESRKAVSSEFGASSGPGKALQAFGKTLATDFYDDATLHVHEAIDCEATTCLRYRLWYPSGAVKTVGAWKGSDMPWVERLDDETRGELHSALEGWPSWTGPNAAFRNGMFRDTQYGIELVLPKSVWNINQPQDQAIFDASDAVNDTQLWVVAEPGVEPRDYHRDVVKDLMGELKAPVSRLAGWKLSAGSMEVMPGVRLPTMLATRFRAGTAFRIVLVGLGATPELGRQLIKRTQLFEPQTSPIDQKGARWTDHRLGVSLDLPAGRWTYKTAKQDTTSSVHAWEADANRIALALVSGVGQSNEQRLEFLMGFIKGASQNVAAEYQGEIRFAGTVGFAYEAVNAAGQTFRTYAAFVGDRMVALIAPDGIIDDIAPTIVVHKELPARK